MTVRLFVLIISFAKLVVGKLEGFIVGGDFADSIRQFPHVAFLELTAEDGSTYICGSSVLTQYILITAAHCYDEVTESTAHVGSVNREKGKPYQVQSFQQHARWNTDTMEHDLCLSRLKRALTLGRVVKRVLLMRRPPKARSAVLAGWGAIEEEDYTDSVVLKHTKQKLWTRRECKRVLDNPPQGTICGGKFRSYKDFASKGDSGSGLIVKTNIIVGVVSYKDVGISRSLVVYTDTAYFYNWIKTMARRLQC